MRPPPFCDLVFFEISQNQSASFENNKNCNEISLHDHTFYDEISLHDYTFYDEISLHDYTFYNE